MKQLIRENRRAIFFLLRFVLVFGGLSLLYGAWVKSFGEEADSFSWFIGKNLVWLAGEENIQLAAMPGEPSIAVHYKGNHAVSLFEGCNGIAVIILFLAFVVAFNGKLLNMVWFSAAGFVIIHLANLGRLWLLIRLADSGSNLFHFMHKYLFSLIIYAVVFALWVIWIRWARGTKKIEKTGEVPT